MQNNIQNKTPFLKKIEKQIPFIKDIQSNILEPHKKEHLMCLFINFRPDPDPTPFSFKDEMEKFEQSLKKYKNSAAIKKALGKRLAYIYTKKQLKERWLVEELKSNSKQRRLAQNELEDYKKTITSKSGKIKAGANPKLSKLQRKFDDKNNYAGLENVDKLLTKIEKCKESEIVEKIIELIGSKANCIKELRILEKKEIVEIKSKIVGQKKIRAWISEFANEGFGDIKITNAYEQLEQAEKEKTAKKATSHHSSMVTSIYFTKALYDVLRIDDQPADPSFQRGLNNAHSPIKLDSPEFKKSDSGKWASGRKKIHAMILLASNDAKQLKFAKSLLTNELKGVGEILFYEKGKKLKDNREHFGFKDVRPRAKSGASNSQPRYFEFNAKQKRYDTIPSFGKTKKDKVAFEDKLRLVLIKEKEKKKVKNLITKKTETFELLDANWNLDSFNPKKDRFGSYLAFVRFEQNMKEFQKMNKSLKAGGVKKIEQVLGIKQSNGAPLKAGQCPMNAHVRKVNPTKKIKLNEAEIIDHERDPALEVNGTKGFIDPKKKHIVRRGIPYNYQENGDSLRPENESGLGLLFMSFQASLKYQFDYMLRKWCNDPNFAEENTGVDALIGQSQTEPKNKLVTYRGMKYFYAPSMPLLKNLYKGIGLPPRTFERGKGY